VARPYDATVKELVESYPLDWLAQLGLAVEGVDVIDADLSTVSAQADKILRVRDAAPWLVHLELQASRDRELPRRVLKYNVLVHERHALPVHSVVFLLRPEADGPELTGRVRYEAPHGRGWVDCGFEVIRLWQRPVDVFLEGGLGTLPLAPISAASPAALPEVIRRMDARLRQESGAGDAAKLWAATYILLGLRYPAEFGAKLLQGVSAMRESSTYQAILQEGREEGRLRVAREWLLKLGSNRFGEPDARGRETIEEAASIEQLDQWRERLLIVESWEELLQAD